MSKPRVYIHRAGSWYSRYMDTKNESELRSVADVITEPETASILSPHELVERMHGCVALLSLNGFGSDTITPEILTKAETIRLICVAHRWGHFRNITEETGIPVIEGSNAVTVCVAEWVITAALMGLRRLHFFDRALKAGEPWAEPRLNAGMLSQSTVGIVGLGRIGRYAAQQFRALGAKVIAYSNSFSCEASEQLGITLVSLNELMSRADVVSVHAGVTDRTCGMIGSKQFSLLKDGCVFINSARAALYDELTFVRELRTGRFTAYIDVYATEPLAQDHPFRSMRNVIITPHNAGNNPVMFLRCGREAVDTLKDYFAGRVPIDRRYDYP